MKEDEMDEIAEFIASKGGSTGISGSEHYTYKLAKLQHLLLSLGIRALVGVRRDTGYFTSEIYIHIPEKSTSGVPYWERIFAPYGFNDYNEALAYSIKRGIEYYEELETKRNELDKKNHE